MWIKVSNEQGVQQGYINVDRMDMITPVDGLDDGQSKIVVRHGTSTKTFYLNNAEKGRLNHYLDTIKYYAD